MPEDLKLSQVGSSQLPPPFRGLHFPGVRKHCQIIFACYFRKLSISSKRRADETKHLKEKVTHEIIYRGRESEGERTSVSIFFFFFPLSLHQTRNMDIVKTNKK